MCLAIELAGYVFAGSGSTVYRAMINNTLLAYIPVEMSMHFSRRSAAAFIALFAAWLLFYPNAPYVLTDYFHLAMIDPYVVLESGRRTSILRPELRLWLSFTVISSCAMTGALAGAWSLDCVAGQALKRLRRTGLRWRAAFALAITVLSSVGIYLGRFPRLHSVHLISRPSFAVDRIIESSDIKLVWFVVLLTTVQMMLWGWVMILKRVSVQETEDADV